ncbi:MAG: MFS transporter [Chloroflexi bacterium]|nr:MFS transporter [Chloroflexota bacterium]
MRDIVLQEDKTERQGHPFNFARTPRVGLSALTWAHFLNDGYINYLPAVLPVLLEELHIPLALVGSLVLSLQGIGSLLQPLVGWRADRAGGRSFVLVGLGMSALGASLIALAPSYWPLIGLLIIAGLGSAAFHPQALASARALTRSREGLTMSFFLIGGELGRGLWPSVAGLLVVWLGLHSLWLFAIPGALTVLVLAQFTPSLPPEPSQAVRTAWESNRRPILALVGFVGLRGMISYGVVTFVPLLWHARGGSLIAGASLISVMLVVGVIGNFFGGVLADRIGRYPVIVGSSLFSALFLSLFLLSQGPWLWVSLAFLGIAVFSTAPVTMLIGQDLFPKSRSMASGIALGVGNALGAVAVFGLGFVAASYGIDASLWWIAGLSLLGLPLAWVLAKKEVHTAGDI